MVAAARGRGWGQGRPGPNPPRGESELSNRPMTLGTADFVPIALSFAGTLALTPAVRAAARRWGMVARPKADRWHTRPTALLGGLAIFVAVTAVELTLVLRDRQALAVLAASTFLFLVGLVDDLVNLKPYQKLVGQVMGVAAVVSSGLVLPWTGSAPLDVAVTAVWLVGITNAVNLLDNMDGLAAGVAAIASSFLALHLLGEGQHDAARMLAVFAAALLGFLVYNSNPASIFMGDCGSMFIGFFLAAAALLGPTGGRSRSFLPVLAVPVLVLFIPIFDTLLVMVLRKLAGRPISRGGRDHASHRLVALGLSERRAVWMLYGLSGLSGLLAVLVRDLPLDVGLAAIAGFTIVLTLLACHLARVKVYSDEEVRLARERPLVAFLVDLSYKRRVFEVCLDVLLITLAFYTAHALVHGPVSRAGGWDAFLPALAVVLGVKLTAFLALGVYRGVWRYVSLEDLITYARAVFAGSAASALVLAASGRSGTTPGVVVALDGLLLLTLLAGSRLTFRVLRRMIPPPVPGGRKRVLIFGAGDAGVLLARELFNNPSLDLVPVGFADDDPLRQGNVIHGLRVYGGNGELPEVCRRLAVNEVVISCARIAPGRVHELAGACRQAAVPLRRLRIKIEEVGDALLGLVEPEAAGSL